MLWWGYGGVLGVLPRVRVLKDIDWEFGEGVDSARGVAAIVVCNRNTSFNSHATQ